MPSSSIWKNIFISKKARDLTELLGSTYIFKELKPLELRILVSLVHVRTFKDGEVVFSEGEPGEGMYIISKGSVDIIVGMGGAKPITLANLEPGNFFGETTLIDGSPRTATAIAKGATELVGFFRPDLISLIEQKPKLGAVLLMRISLVLAERLRKMDKELLFTHDIREGQ